MTPAVRFITVVAVVALAGWPETLRFMLLIVLVTSLLVGSSRPRSS